MLGGFSSRCTEAESGSSMPPMAALTPTAGVKKRRLERPVVHGFRQRPEEARGLSPFQRFPNRRTRHAKPAGDLMRRYGRDAFSRIISRAWRIVIRSAGTDRSLGLAKGATWIRPTAAPTNPRKTPGGLFRYGGRDHLGIGGRHHSVTGAASARNWGAASSRNQHTGRTRFAGRRGFDAHRDETAQRGRQEHEGYRYERQIAARPQGPHGCRPWRGRRHPRSGLNLPCVSRSRAAEHHGVISCQACQSDLGPAEGWRVMDGDLAAAAAARRLAAKALRVGSGLRPAGLLARRARASAMACSGELVSTLAWAARSAPRPPLPAGVDEWSRNGARCTSKLSQAPYPRAADQTPRQPHGQPVHRRRYQLPKAAENRAFHGRPPARPIVLAVGMNSSAELAIAVLDPLSARLFVAWNPLYFVQLAEQGVRRLLTKYGAQLADRIAVRVSELGLRQSRGGQDPRLSHDIRRQLCAPPMR